MRKSERHGRCELTLTILPWVNGFHDRNQYREISTNSMYTNHRKPPNCFGGTSPDGVQVQLRIGISKATSRIQFNVALYTTALPEYILILQHCLQCLGGFIIGDCHRACTRLFDLCPLIDRKRVSSRYLVFFGGAKPFSFSLFLYSKFVAFNGETGAEWKGDNPFSQRCLNDWKYLTRRQRRLSTQFNFQSNAKLLSDKRDCLIHATRWRVEHRQLFSE